MSQQVFPGTLDALAPIREFVGRAAAAAGLDKSASYKLCLAVDEIAAASQRLLEGLVPVGHERRAAAEPHHHGDGVVHSHAAG